MTGPHILKHVCISCMHNFFNLFEQKFVKKQNIQPISSFLLKHQFYKVFYDCKLVHGIVGY
jgi:hypothetical protein